jgi:DNA-binding winged helix-turn-helix (wHTH) protein
MAQAEDRENGQVNLAHVPSFHLGEVEVRPSTRQLIRGDRNETLEPRVMQVLVALAEARGSVITRDELIERCWGGVIVSENAINRVISRIRQVASDFGMDSFQLETITKVGYRMVVAGASSPASAVRQPETERPRRSAGRRRFVLGGLAAAAAGIGAATIQSMNGDPPLHEPSAEARELFRRGVSAQRQGLPDQAKQVIAYFEQAVEADPLYSEAWGALALANCHVLDTFPQGKEAHLAALVRSAARRALALDPGNADAQAALAFVNPMYRNWSVFERRVGRLLVSHPGHWLLRMQLGLMLYQVGRWGDGIEHSRKVLEMDSFLPMTTTVLGRALWSAGRLQEANSLIDAAVARWPQHFMLWNMKYDLLAFSGRSDAAIAFVNNPERPAFGVSPATVANRIVLARAIETRDPGDVASALAVYRAMALDQVESVPIVAPVFAALGRADLAFAAIQRYFFGSGQAAIGAFTRRHTDFLFMPPMAPLWAKDRFAEITRATGLENYWRSTGTLPDYRAV